MNPIVMALLGRQGMSEMGQRGMPTTPGPGVGQPGQPGQVPLTLAQLDEMKRKGQGAPANWLSQLSPAERGSIMPQWSNG